MSENYAANVSPRVISVDEVVGCGGLVATRKAKPRGGGADTAHRSPEAASTVSSKWSS
jgi:hypothetical protein